VRSDGKVTGWRVYRGEKSVERFFEDIVQEYVKIRETLSVVVPLEMKPEDWLRFKNAKDCHICEKSLIKDEFLDSLPVWNVRTRSQKMFLHCTERTERWRAAAMFKKSKRRRRQT